MQNSQELIDKLTRAYEMEEEMAGVLIEICSAQELPTDVAPALRERINRILASIKDDTLRHKQVVLAAKKRFEK